MSTLVWDQVGERFFNAGLDRGVLYLENVSVPWNGLLGLEENFDSTHTPYYIDGIKFYEAQTPNEFSGVLRAFTYPDEFEEVLGIESFGDGFFIHDQQPRSFGLSYRTRLGNDLNGVDLGYRIHLIYNVIATPNTQTFNTITQELTPTEFSWGLVAVPISIPGYKATAHLSFDSVSMDPIALATIEDILYGTATETARLPTITELINLMAEFETITITDNGDGTWTAQGPQHSVHMVDATTFEIEDVTGVYLDEDTYQISSTPPT